MKKELKYTVVYYLKHKNRMLSGPYYHQQAAKNDIERIRELLGGLGVTGVTIEVYETNDSASPQVMFSMYGG